MPTSKINFKVIISLLALVTGIAIAYANTLHSPFNFDDYPNIIDNHFIKIDNLQISNIIRAASQGPSPHRWIPNITLAIQFYYSALNVYPYHIFNIAVHLLSAIALYLLLTTTLEYAGNPREREHKHEISLFATAIWSLHPLQTNAVTYIIQRMTSISALFFMTAILLYAKGRLPAQTILRRNLLLAASAVSGLLAIASKENAAMLPAMIVLYEICIIPKAQLRANRRRIILSLAGAGFLLLLVGWLWLGGNLINQILHGYGDRYFTLSQRLMTEARIVFYYLGLIILPLPSFLNINHDITISTSLFSPPSTILSIIGLLALGYATFYLFNKNRMLSFALLWFLGNLLIESSIIPLELCYEHRLYLPATFLLFALILLLFKFAPQQIKLLRAGLVIIIIGLGVMTWNRNAVWQSSSGLWTDSLAKSPNLIRSHVNLGRSLIREKDYAAAETTLLQALAIDAGRNIDHNLPAWRKEMSQVHSALAILYREQKKFAQSRANAEEAVRLDQGSTDALLTLGISLVEEGNYGPAFDIFTRIAAAGVDTVDLYNNWGISAYNLGDTDRAIFFLRHALKLDPNHAESHYNLGIAYGAKGMQDEARREMALGMQL